MVKLVQIKPAVERSTSALSCIAAILIANSHLENLYPKPWIAADGLIGNSLFFFLAGYGLARSEVRQHRTFGHYYWKRILRMYPSLWLIGIFFLVILGGAWHTWQLSDYGTNLLYPTDYGFITQIMVFYVPFYFLISYKKERLLLGLVLALTVPFAVLCFQIVREGRLHALQLGTLDTRLWWIFFFQVMLLGGAVGIQGKARWFSDFRTAGIVFISSFTFYVASKFAMVKGMAVAGTGIPSANFFFVLHLLTCIIVLALFSLFTSKEFCGTIRDCKWAHWLIGLIGGLTLEIYLSHLFVSHSAWVAKIGFPWNVGVFFVVTILISWPFALVANALRTSMTPRDTSS